MLFITSWWVLLAWWARVQHILLLLWKKFGGESRSLVADFSSSATTGWLGGVNPYNPAQFATPATSGKYIIHSPPLARDISQLNRDLINLWGLETLKDITHPGPPSINISQTPFFLFLPLNDVPGAIKGLPIITLWPWSGP